MKIKIICQICGTPKTIDTELPMREDHPGWETHKLEQFGIEGIFDNYEIWLCGKCRDRAFLYEYSSYNEDGSRYYETEYDWDKLSEIVCESLLIHSFDKKVNE